jgi:hypothetical protein
MQDILRADELKIAKDNYETWLRLDRAAKKAAYATAAGVGEGRRVNRGNGTAFIQPFGGPDNFWYEAKVLAAPATPATATEEAATALITAVMTASGGFRVAAVPAGPNNVSNLAKKIQFAKVRCTERNGTGVATTSRITKLPYTKYNTNTVSNSFGRGNTTQAAADTEPEARRVIQGLLMAGTPAGRTVGFKSQGFVGNISIAAAA